MRHLDRVIWLALLTAACGDNHGQPDAAARADGPAVDSPPDAPPLETLFGTGLCVDRACTQISPGISTYQPRFPLWADGATKLRWMYLPPGTQIDTTDMDHWVFPIGTKFWKEFDIGGVRVETRYITKLGDGNSNADWFYVGYQWNATNDDTTAVPTGAVDANGTQHDIPPRYQCRLCHENLQPTRILGFGAIQLDAPAQRVGDLDLDAVIANGWLTNNPTGASSPHYPFPGNATENAALGYLHANCGHCHNPTSTVYTDNGITMQLRETVAGLGSLATTPPYLTAVDQAAMKQVGVAKNCTAGAVAAECIIDPANPDQSAMIVRFESTDPAIHMPQMFIGTKMTDPTGDTTLRNWITALQ